MKKLLSVICLLFLASPAISKAPNYRIQNSPQTAKVVVIGDSEGNSMVLTDQGELKTTTSISGDVNIDTASLKVQDSDGDEWDIRSDNSGNIYLTGTDLNLATDTAVEDVEQSVIDVLNQLTGGGVKRDWTLGSSQDSVSVNGEVDANVDTDVDIVSSVDLPRSWNLGHTNDDVKVYTEGPNTDQPLRANPAGKLLVVSTADDTFVVTAKRDWTLSANSDSVDVSGSVGRTWSLDATNDTVNLAQGDIETTNDTDVDIVSSIALPRSWTLDGSSDSVNISNAAEIGGANDTDVDVVSSVPLDRNWSLSASSDTVNLSQGEISTTNDTDVVIHAFGSDTITAIGNALRVTESRPQRSLFNETTGETATVTNNALHVAKQDLSEDTVVYNDMTAGETVSVNISNSEEWELKTDGADVHYSTANNNPDTFTGMKVFDQTGVTEDGIEDGTLNIFATGNTKTWVRIRR